MTSRPLPPEQQSEVLADLHNEEISAIAAQVVELVGRARRAIADRTSASTDLADAGLGFLTQLLEPLERCLAQVDGDTEALTAKAHEWRRIGDDLGETHRRLTQIIGDAWSGAAADRFASAAGGVGGRIEEAASACHSMTSLLGTSADLMTGARGLIVDIIDRVVDHMIAMEAAAEAAATFTAGASEAAALSAILGEVGDGVEQAIAIVDRVGELLERIATTLHRLRSVFAAIAEQLARLSEPSAVSRGPAPAPFASDLGSIGSPRGSGSPSGGTQAAQRVDGEGGSP